MAAVTIPTTIARPLTTTFSIIAIVSITVIIVYHAITVHKNYASRKQASKMSIITSFLLLTIGCIISLMLTLEEFVHVKAICDMNMVLGLPFYILFKLTLYLYLTMRVHFVFKNAADLEYSSKKLKVWAGIIMVWSIANIVLVNIGLTQSFDASVYPSCDLEANQIGLMSMALQDIVCAGINAFLFVRPVLKLRKKIEDAGPSGKSQDIKQIAIKQCVLSLTAIISTVIALFGIILLDLPAVWIGLDIIISALSILLS